MAKHNSPCVFLSLESLEDRCLMSSTALLRFAGMAGGGQQYGAVQSIGVADTVPALSGSGKPSGEPAPFDYANTFICLPAPVPFRPGVVTPNPVVTEARVPVVVGPGSELSTDRYGRVKVQFFWDRLDTARDACWVRVSQMWAGKNRGVIFVPRICEEVVVIPWSAGMPGESSILDHMIRPAISDNTGIAIHRS
jgi:hypothetical protein